MKDFSIVEKNGVTLIKAHLLEKHSWFRHAFSTRKGGISPSPHQWLNLSSKSADDPNNIVENRRRFLAAAGLDRKALVLPRQVHGNRAFIVSEKDRLPRDADGSVTDSQRFAIGVQVSDCVPLIAVDVDKRVIAAIHAGWRGLAAGVVSATIGKMSEELACRPGDLEVAVGPSISPCCYTVGEVVMKTFSRSFAGWEALFSEREGEIRLDLRKGCRLELLSNGVREERIACTGLCTYCHDDLFFSFRRDGGMKGGMMAVAGLFE